MAFVCVLLCVSLCVCACLYAVNLHFDGFSMYRQLKANGREEFLVHTIISTFFMFSDFPTGNDAHGVKEEPTLHKGSWIQSKNCLY